MGTLISGSDITLTLKRDLTAGEPYPLRSGATGVPPPAQVTVNAPEGVDFGGAPTVVLFHQFIGSHLDDVPLTADIGEWTNVGNYGTGNPKLWFDSTTNRTWMAGRNPLLLDSTSFNIQTLYKYFGDFTQFRYSQRSWVPTDKIFPGATAPGQMPETISSWKTNWLGVGNPGSRDITGSALPYRNVCIPSQIGGGVIAVDGNSNAPALATSPTKFYGGFSFTAPTLYSYYQESAGFQGQFTVPGEFLSVNDQTATRRVGLIDPFSGSPDADFTTRDYSAIRVPGWFTNPPGGNFVNILPLINDVYMAIGPNSRATIIVNDATTLLGSTTGLVFQVVQDIWNSAQIKFTPAAHSDLGENMHVHLIKADGTLLENLPFERATT